MNLFKKRKKNYPDFWMDYLERFNAKPENDLSKIRFVVLDTETTGFDYEADRILSIGALSLQNNHINVNQSLEVYLYQHFYHA